MGGTSYLKGWSGSDALALAGNSLSDGGDATVLVPGVDFVAPSMSADREVMVGLVDPTQIGLQEGIDLVINPLLLRDVLEPGDYYLTVLTGDIVNAAEYAGYAGRESASSVEGFMSAPWSRLHIDFTVLSQASPDVYLTGGASDCWDEDLLVCSIEISEGEDLSSFEDFIQIIAKNPGVDASPYHGQIYSTLDSSGDSSITRHVVGGAFDTCPCSCGMADCPGDTSVGPPRCVQCCKDWCKDKDVRVWGDIDSGNADDEQDTELAEERSATDDSVRVLCYCRDGSVSSCIQSYLQGVQILRVHDVNEINQSIKVFKELIK